MSIVGPRPERPEIAAEYEKEMPEFRLRLQARAGLTGYATREVNDYLETLAKHQAETSLYHEAEKTKKLRDGLYYKLPKFWRAKFYYWYRYYIKLGFLDGKAGKVHCNYFYDTIYCRYYLRFCSFNVKNTYINDTYMMSFEKDGVIHRYSLQHMNRSVFKDPVTLMNNILQVTDYLKEQIKKQGGDPQRETLDFVRAKTGEPYFIDSFGEYWRAYHYVEDALRWKK